MQRGITSEVVLREQPEPTKDLAKYLDDTVAQKSGLPAVVDSNGSTLSYGELSAAADRIAAFLYRRGIVASDNVGFFMRKSSRMLAAIFGVFRLGATYVPTDVGSSVKRASSVFFNCNVRVILTDPESASHLTWAAPWLGGYVVLMQSYNNKNPLHEDYQTLDMLLEEVCYYQRRVLDATRLAYIRFLRDTKRSRD